MKNIENTKAFTLIELLVVVAIVGTLAAVILASLGGARESARVATMVQDFRTIETAMTMWGLNEGWTEWPNASTLERSSEHNEGNPHVSGISEATSLNDYISNVPQPPFGDTPYIYQSTGEDFACDSSGSPTTSRYAGTNIRILGGLDRDIAEELDLIIDGGDSPNLGCGKLRWRGAAEGDLFYSLSDEGSF